MTVWIINTRTAPVLNAFCSDDSHTDHFLTSFARSRLPMVRACNKIRSPGSVIKFYCHPRTSKRFTGRNRIEGDENDLVLFCVNSFIFTEQKQNIPRCPLIFILVEYVEAVTVMSVVRAVQQEGGRGSENFNKTAERRVSGSVRIQSRKKRSKK